MYLRAFLIFLLINSIVLFNVYLINHLEKFGSLNIFSILFWVNLNLIVIALLLFALFRTFYKNWVETSESDLKRKLFITFVVVLGIPFIFLTSVAIVGKSSYLRVFTEDKLKVLLLELQNLKSEISNLKGIPQSEREKILEDIAKVENKTKNLRFLVKKQKLVLVNFVSTFVLIAVLVLLGAVSFAAFLTKVISKPVEVFYRTLRDFSEGDFSKRVDVKSFPIGKVKELKLLASDFNNLLDRLVELYGKLKREKFLFEEVFAKVTTGVAIFHGKTGDIVKANPGYKLNIGINNLGELKEWLKDKDYYRFEEKDLGGFKLVFVEDLRPYLINKRYAAWKEIAERLAHDVKNPLNAIQIQLEILERLMDKDLQKLKEFFPSVKREIENQIGHITDLIDAFNNLSSQDFKLKKEFFSLRQFLFEVKRPFENDHFKVYVEGESAFIRADKKALKRVFENLIKNAYEAIGKTKGEGFVRIRVKGNEIHITDNGPGIPPEKVDKVFLPFVSTKGKGRGLGLFNVRRIIEEHGWKIELLPSKKGEGAHFVIVVDPRDIKKRPNKV